MYGIGRWPISTEGAALRTMELGMFCLDDVPTLGGEILDILTNDDDDGELVRGVSLSS